MGGKAKREAAKRASASSAPALPNTGPISADAGTAEAPNNNNNNSNKSSTRPRSKSNGAKQAPAQTTIGESKESSSQSTAKTNEESTSQQQSPDVFEYLDKGESDGAGRLTHARRASATSAPYSRIVQPLSKSDRRKSSTSYSFYSDSGISLRDHSPDRASSIASADYQPPTPPDFSYDPFSWKMLNVSKTRHHYPMAGAYLTDSESMLDGPISPTPGHASVTSPETYYATSRHLPGYVPKLGMPLERSSGKTYRPDYSSKVGGRQRRKSSDPNGMLSKDHHNHNPIVEIEPELPPLCRRFKSLNVRVLHHLQDELTKMEEDLTVLDELEETHNSIGKSRNHGKQTSPVARRQELQSHEYAALQQKRNELIENIVEKTEKYSRIFLSFFLNM